MKFLADMGISMTTVRWLKSLKHDVVHLREIGFQQMPDEEIFRKAKEEGRVILTFDLDFGDIIAASHEQSVSVIIFRMEDERPAAINARLVQILTESTEALLRGAIILVEDWRYRVRQLPIAS